MTTGAAPILDFHQLQAAVEVAKDRFGQIRFRHPIRSSVHSNRTSTYFRSMNPIAPGDRVVAINTDMSRPLQDPTGSPLSAFAFPDGPLRRDVVYHVASVQPQSGPHQGLFITGLRVLLRERQIPWNSSRFRKVDSLKVHPPRKRRRKQPVTAVHRAT